MTIINKMLLGGPLGFQIESWDVRESKYRLLGVLVWADHAMAFAESISLHEKARVRVVNQKQRKLIRSEKGTWVDRLPDSAVVAVWADGERQPEGVIL